MRFVIFGLSVSSAWGNGHATLWRSLIRALDAAGHAVIFYEKDVPYYASQRDLSALPGRSRLRLYGAWEDVASEASAVANTADVAMVTSYCPDGRSAARVVLDSRAQARVFYDLDTPVTLTRLNAGEEVPYLPAEGLGNFDLVLSYTGGRALDLLETRLGARRVAALYGSVDPDFHTPVAASREWTGDCSYLGTWSADRQASLDTLFVEPARRDSRRKFVLGGSLYPGEVVWPSNVAKFEHVPPPCHPSFYCSSPLTVNVTRGPMAEMGFCPSGRLFEAAACGVPVLSDFWEGLEAFFTPGEEIFVARTTVEALNVIARPPAELARVGRRARERANSEHCGSRRAAELVEHVEATLRSTRRPPRTPLRQGDLA